MSELFKVNSPLPGQEVNRVRPQGPTQAQVQIQNVPDPTKVTQPNQQNDVHTDREAGKFLPNYESNYDKFLQLLRAVPNGINLYEELFFAQGAGTVVSSGISEGLTAELSEYMQLLQMDESELLDFVKGQLQNSVKFQGPVFDILRQVFVGTSSAELQYSMLDLLKRFDSMTSSQHIFNEIFSNLENIAGRMPPQTAEKLEQLMQSLVKEHANGQNGANISHLKNTILPFLAQHISTRGDFGPVRDLTTMFVLNLARYESGNADNFLQSLRTLMNFNDVADAFSGLDIKELENYFTGAKYPDNRLVETLTNVIARGVNGEAGIQNKPVFENILQSMLVNESVYMPLLHAVIPAEVGGKMFYSEMWVDPDSEDGGSASGNPADRSIKVLLKYDIKNTGYFEMIILAKDGNLNMQLFYPDQFQPFRNEIRSAITGIVERNNLTVSGFQLDRVTLPKTISEVFPKIYERKNAINVII